MQCKTLQANTVDSCLIVVKFLCTCTMKINIVERKLLKFIKREIKDNLNPASSSENLFTPFGKLTCSLCKWLFLISAGVFSHAGLTALPNHLALPLGGAFPASALQQQTALQQAAAAGRANEYFLCKYKTFYTLLLG